MVEKELKYSKMTAPWNLYLNDLIERVKDGWIIILDDDDYFKNKNSLNTINEHLIDEMCIYVWKMERRDKKVSIPEDEYFGKTPFERNHIGMPCFTFHKSAAKNISFDGNKAGDFRFINKLYNKLGQVTWINKELVVIPQKRNGK